MTAQNENNELLQEAVATFAKVPGVYQQIFKQMGVENFSDDLVAAIKKNPKMVPQLVLENKQLLQAITSVYAKYKNEIMKKVSSETSMFRDGGKMEYLVSKFQFGGLLTSAFKSAGKQFLQKAGQSMVNNIGNQLGNYAGQLLSNGVSKMFGGNNSFAAAGTNTTATTQTTTPTTQSMQSPILGQQSTGNGIPSPAPIKAGDGEKMPLLVVSSGSDGNVRSRGEHSAYTWRDTYYPTGDNAGDPIDYDWTPWGEGYAKNVFRGNTLEQHYVAPGQYGTPRRVVRVIKNYQYPSQADTSYIDASSRRLEANRHPGVVARILGVAHSPAFIKNVDTALEGFEPVELNEKEVKYGNKL